MADNNQSAGIPTCDALENFEQLIWMYLDESLPEEEFPKLEEMLQTNGSYVQVYLDCVQLHASLIEHYQGPRPLKIAGLPESPVLGSLGEGVPGVGTKPPVT